MKKYAIILMCFLIICVASGCGAEKEADPADTALKGNVEFRSDDGDVLFTTDDIESIDTATIDSGGSESYAVDIQFTDEAAVRFFEVTKELVGTRGRLNIYVNGLLISRPTVNVAIKDGHTQITGFDTLLSAYEVVSAIRNGTEIESSQVQEQPEDKGQEAEPEESGLPESNPTTEATGNTEKDEVPHRDGMAGISDKDIHDIGEDFSCSRIDNDVTGNWRVSTIANSDVQMEEYALSFHKWKFRSDREIHAIINFSLNTTTKLMVQGDVLVVDVYDYVSGEEHDADLMFSGTQLKEYFVYLDNGDIEEIY